MIIAFRLGDREMNEQEKKEYARKRSDIRAELNKQVRLLVGNDTRFFWFTDILMDRGQFTIEIGSFEFFNRFCFDINEPGMAGTIDPDLMKQRVIGCLESIKELINEYIDKINRV